MTVTESPSSEAGSADGVETPRRRAWMIARASGPLLVAAEAGVAVCVAVTCVLLARAIDVNPLDRFGQVSGLAALGLHHVALGLLVLAVVGLVSYFAAERSARIAAALGCAAVAGLLTGFVGGGLTVALHGTVWPLYADQGDTGRIVGWANDVMAGGAAPADYPPGVIRVMTAWMTVTGAGSEHTYQLLQIGGAALFGPIAYLAWRALLRPQWALVMTLVAAAPMIDLYKPYANLVLVVLFPVLARLLHMVRTAADRSWRDLALAGAAAGLVLGLLFVVYSGWFVWSAPGVFLVALAVFPWRSGPARALVVIGCASAAFVVIAARHLLGLTRAAGGKPDSYHYFDTYVEPAYIAMWRNDLPGAVKDSVWPPSGELAGVGLFSVLLVIGLGVAIALGRRRVEVLLLVSCLAGAWLVRFWLASRMYETGAVQLYPRTTAEILYCLLALGVLAVMLVVGRGQELHRRWRAANDAVPVLRPARSASVLGLLAACLLAGLFMGSSTADRYQPLNDDSAGFFAYVAQHVRQPDGTCPRYTAPTECFPNGETANAVLKTQWK